METNFRSVNSGSCFLSVTVSENTDTEFLSIGEVLGILLEEFPDVTISKIRFLESQGLIDPERTASGYRKFYETDVELLKVILREQRENYLPLRVIKDRIDSGAIDPSGEIRKDLASHIDFDFDDSPPERSMTSLRALPTQNVEPSVEHHPQGVDEAEAQFVTEDPYRIATDTDDHTPVTPHLLPGVVLSREELCTMVGLTVEHCEQLEQFGILTGRGTGPARLFNEDAVEIGRLAAQFIDSGVDARHLRGWMTAADREASLYEQLVTPRMRQRNPQARTEALAQLRHLDDLGAKMRTAMMRKALRHHFEG
jgi:DNA-binding transcriptional MerR regulator